MHHVNISTVHTVNEAEGMVVKQLGEAACIRDPAVQDGFSTTVNMKQLDIFQRDVRRFFIHVSVNNMSCF